jgi:hypothetical protein
MHSSTSGIIPHPVSHMLRHTYVGQQGADDKQAANIPGSSCLPEVEGGAELPEIVQ